MPNLFWRSKDGRTINLAETPFKSEDEFERYVYDVGEILSEIFILSRQVKTPSRKDVPDIVGVDKENNVVIIESSRINPLMRTSSPKCSVTRFGLKRTPTASVLCGLRQKTYPMT